MASRVPRVMHLIPDLEIGQHELSVASSVPRVLHMIPDKDTSTSHLEIGEHESSVASSVSSVNAHGTRRRCEYISYGNRSP